MRNNHEYSLVDELKQTAEFFAWCALIIDAIVGAVFFAQLFLNMIGW